MDTLPTVIEKKTVSLKNFIEILCLKQEFY